MDDHPVLFVCMNQTGDCSFNTFLVYWPVSIKLDRLTGLSRILNSYCVNVGSQVELRKPTKYPSMR